MSKSTVERITNIIEKRHPLTSRIENVEANLKSLSSALYRLEDYCSLLTTKVDDTEIIGHLKEINLSQIQQDIIAELGTLGKLRMRFSRDTLNIGVVGRARQGKSRLLQSLTGLTAAEIPDGNRQHCTGVRSTIHHNSSVETYGEVWFYSERTFLDEVISLYYEKLCLGSKPLTINEFANKPLPHIPDELNKLAEFSAMYEHLRNYHDNFEKYAPLLRELSPRRIGKDEIRSYVAQDNMEGERIYFNYLAVREVKIVCCFPNSEVGKIALVDMPGLGDTGIGDAERMVKTLGQDVDAVVFVRMPKALGDCWVDVDVRLYDTASTSLVDLPIKLWSFMVLNQISATSKNDDNSENCKAFAQDIARKHIDVAKVVITNCADTEDANQLLNQILNYLTDNINRLDTQYASSCQERLNQLQNAVQVELNKARNILGQAVQRENEFPEFIELFDQLWNKITNGLEELLTKLGNQRGQEDKDFKEQIDLALQTCKVDSGIPSIEEIKERNNREGGYSIAYNKYLNEMRAHLSQHFLLLDNGLKRSLDRVKSQVAEVLINDEQGRLGRLSASSGANFIQEIAVRIPDQLRRSEPSRLKFGFQIIADFMLSYRGMIQHRIRKCLDGLTPNDSAAIPLPKSPSAQHVLDNLKFAHAEAVFKCETALADLLCEPSQAAFSMVEEFLDRILRASAVKKEWEIFLYEERSTIWPSEFEKLGEQTRLRRKWLEVIEEVDKVSQADLLQFIQ